MKILDTLFLIGRQPTILEGDGPIIWCVSPDIVDFNIRKLSLKDEGATYKLLVSETTSPIMHNAWFSTLMANVLFGKLISCKQGVCYLNKPTDSARFVRASHRQVSKVKAAVRVTFSWGDRSVEYSGAIAEDISKVISQRINARLISRPQGLNEIKINVTPVMSVYEINALCELVCSCLL